MEVIIANTDSIHSDHFPIYVQLLFEPEEKHRQGNNGSPAAQEKDRAAQKIKKAKKCG